MSWITHQIVLPDTLSGFIKILRYENRNRIRATISHFSQEIDLVLSVIYLTSSNEPCYDFVKILNA